MLKLRPFREKAGKTQQEVAKFLGVSRPTYTRYENGEREPDYQTLCKLSRYFKVSIDELLDQEVIKKEPTIPNDDELKKILQDPLYKAIYDKLMQLNPENLQMALSVIEGMINHQDKKEDH